MRRGLRRLRQRVWLRRRRMDRRLLRLRWRVRKLLAVVAVLRPVDLALLLAGQMTSTTLTLSRVGRWPLVFLRVRGASCANTENRHRSRGGHSYATMPMPSWRSTSEFVSRVGIYNQEIIRFPVQVALNIPPRFRPKQNEFGIHLASGRTNGHLDGWFPY